MNNPLEPGLPLAAGLEEVKLFLPPELARAFRRGLWSAINETGREQLVLMAEVAEDFLIKYGN